MRDMKSREREDGAHKEGVAETESGDGKLTLSANNEVIVKRGGGGCDVVVH